MSQVVRKLAAGEVVVGFLGLNGKRVGELVDVAVGHEVHSYSVPGLRDRLARGQVIAVTIGKSSTGEIRVFGSFALDDSLEERARLVAEASRELSFNAPSITGQGSV